MNAETEIRAADNLHIWEAVSKTDPRHTKKVNQRGGFTAISAHYQVMSATKAFGPVGIGWGYRNGEPIWQDNLVIVPVTLWHGDRECEFGPIYGGAEWKSAQGRLDSDAPKKAATDGLTKALSHLGFNADVFLGRFDDNKYVEQVQKEFEDADREEAHDQKIVGITKIRNNLNKLRRDGGKATELEAFNALVHDCRDDLQKIKDAQHTLWTGMGEDFDGFAKWIKRRRDELTPTESTLAFQLLVSSLNEVDSHQEMQGFLWKHGDTVGVLDGEESRKFEALYDERAEALKMVAQASV